LAQLPARPEGWLVDYRHVGRHGRHALDHHDAPGPEMMHPDHADMIRILILAGLTAVIGERLAKAGWHLWSHLY
jgi:hypothetical protein